MPTTRAVSVREFRENMTGFLKEAREKNVHFVIMRHAVPVAHIAPIQDEEASIEALAARVAQARKDADEGHTYTAEEVLAMIDHHASRIHTRSRAGSHKATSSHRAKDRKKIAVVRSAAKSPVVRKKTHR
jgi:antitoxin (DNA-binding transcriptional repressor) of toxin-antitoxin stability system